MDFRFAIRGLARSPGFAIIAILTLTLGIGVNSAVFSLANTVLVRPLPFTHPNRLAIVFERNQHSDHGNVSGHEFVAWRDESHSFDALALMAYQSPTLTGQGEPLTVESQVVTAQFFDVLGTRPILGRTFQRGDDQPGAARIVVLSHSLWQSRFGADSNVIGRRITLDDAPYEIVGVMPSRGDLGADLWTPLDIVTEAQRVGKHSNNVYGRLRAGVTLESAQRDLDGVAQRLAERLPDANAGHGVHVASFYEEMIGDVRRPFYVALAAAALVLLIACANVGHLLLTRAASRQKELAVRSAMGAGRLRLMRQLITESLLLSLIGGTTGLLIATWATDLLPASGILHVPRLDELSTDWRVIAATAGFCVFSALACGVIPAIRATSAGVATALNEGSRSSTGPGRRVAKAFVISEVAIALVVLVGAGLTMKSLIHLRQTDPGFNPRGVVTIALPLSTKRYRSAERQRDAVRELVTRISAVPGVQFAGVTNIVPLESCCNNMGITVEGYAPTQSGEETRARMTVVGGRYFDAMRIPLRRGRLFQPSDARLSVPLIRWYPQQPAYPRADEPQAAPVAVINEAMAKRYWPNEDPIGKRFSVLFSASVTVVGVVADTRQATLTETPAPEIFLSDLQEPIGSVTGGLMTLVVRSQRDPAVLSGELRRTIHEFDSQIPIGAITTMDRIVWNSIGRPRFNTLLIGVSGAIALVLAMIGVYGVISYGIERRTREIGIRCALGAQAKDVLRLVLGEAVSLVATGLAIGGVCALAGTRFLGSLLYDVQPTDVSTFLIVAALLGGVALLAGWVPGRRAMRIDPTEALKAE